MSKMISSTSRNSNKIPRKNSKNILHEPEPYNELVLTHLDPLDRNLRTQSITKRTWTRWLANQELEVSKGMTTVKCLKVLFYSP